jgi:UDP-2-acetamido-3-amino-2,3-dideoxy-glucuronate N-acetyltransferase
MQIHSQGEISQTLKPLLISFPTHNHQRDCLAIYASPDHVPFPIQRTFVIKVANACTRGKHAHKKCAQLLVCLQGRCVATVDDGQKRHIFTLDGPEHGLFMPPGLWGEQHYDDNTILMVFADQAYDENDYIRNYKSFLTWTKQHS